VFGMKRLKARVCEMENRQAVLAKRIEDNRVATCKVCGHLGIASKMLVVHVPERHSAGGLLVPPEFAETMASWVGYVAGISGPRVHLGCLAGSAYDRRKAPRTGASTSSSGTCPECSEAAEPEPEPPKPISATCYGCEMVDFVGNMIEMPEDAYPIGYGLMWSPGFGASHIHPACMKAKRASYGRRASDKKKKGKK